MTCINNYNYKNEANTAHALSVFYQYLVIKKSSLYYPN